MWCTFSHLKKLITQFRAHLAVNAYAPMLNYGAALIFREQRVNFEKYKRKSRENKSQGESKEICHWIEGEK